MIAPALFLTVLISVPGSPGAGSVAPMLSGQSRLNVEASAFAQAWTSRDMDGLRSMIAAGGIRLHLPDEEHQILQPRLALAALEAFLRPYSPGEAEVNRSSPTGGGSREGFAEVVWTTVSKATREPAVFTIFVGYRLVGDRWAATEIRVLYE